MPAGKLARARFFCFSPTMSHRTPALRGSLLAVCASLALASFAAQAEEKSTPANEALDSLPTTVVTAGRFEESSASQTQGVSVITAQDIAQTGSRSVTDALTRVLGIPVKIDLFGGGNPTPDLRGYGSTTWSNQVLIIDGVRMNEGDLSNPQINSLPIESIERIEIVRGAASVLYGDGASAGAIIISTKAGLGIARKTGGSIKVGLGNQKQRELAANATFAAGNGFSLDASAQKSLADNHRQNFASNNETARVGVQWSNDWLRLGANISSDKKKSGLPGALTAAQNANNPWQSNTPNDHTLQRSEQQGLFAQAQLGAWELAFDTNWRDKASRANYGGFQSDFDLDARSTSLRARQQHKGANFSNALTLGWDYNRWQRDTLGAWPSKALAKNTGWYIKDELNLPSSGTQLSAGLRREKTEKTESGSATDLNKRVSAWELGIAQSITPEWTAFARAAKAFRLANVDEFSFVPAGYTIQPQTSKDLEAGLRWNTATNKLELRAYRSRITNEIGYDATVPPFGANINFDPTTRSGLELDARSQISSSLSLSANAAVRQAKFRAGAYTGKTVPLVPKQTLSLGANWQALPQHGFDVRANLVAQQQVDFNNTCRVPSYATLDVGYRYTVGNWELNTQVQNLGDKRYYIQYNSCNPLNRNIYPESGRRINATLSYQF